jgi:hypothetical protein
MSGGGDMTEHKYFTLLGDWTGKGGDCGIILSSSCTEDLKPHLWRQTSSSAEMTFPVLIVILEALLRKYPERCNPQSAKEKRSLRAALRHLKRADGQI